MRGQVSLSFLLVLLCTSNEWTRTEGYYCTQREGTSLTILMDAIMTYDGFPNYLEKALNSVSARFPCVTRQYTSVILDYAETNENITSDMSDFQQSISRNRMYDSNHISYCDQSLLYGLKRALEISPAESLILVYTVGSMVDYNDTRLLSEVYALLEEKKSQVYFLWYSRGYCTVKASQQDVFNEISSLSYGKFINMSTADYYTLIHSLVLLLSKSLNSSVHILNIHLNITDKYTEVFNVPTSLTYLLITRDARFTFDITDSKGNKFAFERNPKDNGYYTYILSSHLIKSPAAGSWILNAQGNSSLSVQIVGFTAGLDKSGNCLDSDCHPNATCSEFGGYGECTCKEGFVGDGTRCNDIDECQDYNTHNCFSGGASCVNTIGSYTCNCYTGYKYIAEFGCVDIDECANSSLNDCDPIAICKNLESGYYTCTCPYGYYGDGRHCEVNECQQGILCGSTEDCIKYIGSYSCIDPCSNHTVLNDLWRSTSNIYNSSDFLDDWNHCDDHLSGWYRFKGLYDQQIPEYCVAKNSCGTKDPIWMNGSHPTLSDGIVNRTVCSNGYDGCCTRPYNISVKMCPEGFHVYKLQSTPTCYDAYCTESNHSCSGLDCAPNERCGIVDGVHGCYFQRGPEGYQCTHREGISLTVLMDEYLAFRGVSHELLTVLETLSPRFPCHTQQHTAVTLDYAETNEVITDVKSKFRYSIIKASDDDSFDYYYKHAMNCNQSLLYGLKRALEISPAESIIFVYTVGSMVDYSDTQLLSEVYTMLEEKKSLVYFLWYPLAYCTINPSQQDVLNDILFRSYGEFIDMGNPNNYKLWHLLELLLSKPLNSTVRILNIHVNVMDKSTEVFSVPTSLTYLLITRDERVTLNFTDPYGNVFSFEKNPNYYYYSYYKYIISSHLIKNPAAGSWILNVQENLSLSVQILGITELNKSENCSDSDCHPNATCSEFGGYGECTCKKGFSGDGITCKDINECQDYYTHNCNSYSGGSCVNTIGSYTCNCYTGLKYISKFGCVDIDECTDHTFDCDPIATCTNNIESYTCTCPYGYYGDGRHCEVNECQQGTPCNFKEECIKNIGSYSCTDPCSNHTVLNDPWRSTSNVYTQSFNWYHCDYDLSGWYRFKGEYDQQIPEHCVAVDSCGTTFTIWMNGPHPTVSDGIVNRTACSRWYDRCCKESYNILVKMCPEGFYVYKLQSTRGCSSAYCTESNHSCSGLDCAPDEECGIVDGVHGCYCNDSSNTPDGIQRGNVADYLAPQVTCGLETIEVRFSKCLLEKLGYDTSSIHLRDYSCQGVIERSDKSYITFVLQPVDGSCGGYIMDNGTSTIYINTVYLKSKSDGAITGDEYSINFTCSYTSNMEVILRTADKTSIASATINVVGTANFVITMGLFQDSGYTTPYTGSEVWLDSSSILYVGVIIPGATGSSQFVLVMKDCYATPTADSTYVPRYDIIKDRCPNKKDPTISVLENGVSLRGHFSLQVFSFVGDFNQIYLHCQVGLCDTSSNDCSARCPSVRSALDDIKNVRSLTVGPIFRRADEPSGGGTAVATAKLFFSTIVFLLLLY